MAYTAIDKMYQHNFNLFGAGAGPKQPSLPVTDNPNDLRSAALRFIHERCEGLCFDEAVSAREENMHIFEGTGLKLYDLLLLSGNVFRTLRKIQKNGRTAFRI